jgi:LPS export ABC transporter protein LptC
MILSACTFDYSAGTTGTGTQPDIVMEDVEYVRVRDGDPIVRFTAEKAERWEEKQTMDLQSFSFEQFENHGDEINAAGSAGTAQVELDSLNIRLRDGVSIAVDSEDITIETVQLDWQDKERLLSGSAGEEVRVHRADGTSFTGRGFSADIRNRTWEFSGEVSGTYIQKDDEEEKEDDLQ